MGATTEVSLMTKTKTVRIERTLADRARIVAAIRGTTPGALLGELAGAELDRLYGESVRKTGVDRPRKGSRPK